MMNVVNIQVKKLPSKIKSTFGGMDYYQTCKRMASGACSISYVSIRDSSYVKVVGEGDVKAVETMLEHLKDYRDKKIITW